jgi:hypothetical protein
MTDSPTNRKAADLHKRAKAVEEQWRAARGLDGKLQSKRQQKAKAKLERGEARHREQRRQQRRIERGALRVPLLKGVE